MRKPHGVNSNIKENTIMKIFRKDNLNHIGTVNGKNEQTENYTYGNTKINVSKIKDMTSPDSYIVISIDRPLGLKSSKSFNKEVASYFGLNLDKPYNTDRNVISGKLIA